MNVIPIDIIQRISARSRSRDLGRHCSRSPKRFTSLTLQDLNTIDNLAIVSIVQHSPNPAQAHIKHHRDADLPLLMHQER
jgi:hypothetical protein